MKKICWVLILGITMGLVLGSKGYAAWPINRTRPIEGRITDATTGKPIERVIVVGRWRKQQFIGNPGGPPSSDIGYEYSVTDKDGRYRLPAKISFHIGTGFDSLSLTIMHPLYEQKRISGFYLKLNPKEGWIYRNERGERLNLVPKGGVIYYNISLLSLEEKYREIDRTKRVRNLPIQIYDIDDEMMAVRKNGMYFYQAKNLGISKKELNDFILEWEKIAEKYSDEERKYLKESMRSFKLFLKKKGIL